MTQLASGDEVKKLRSAAPDIKESFEIGREGEPFHPNQWPKEQDDMEGFQSDMLAFFEQCRLMHVEVMKAIAVGMGLDESFFDSYVDVGDNTLRLLHYPAVKANVFKVNPGQVRAGEHSVRGRSWSSHSQQADKGAGLRFYYTSISGLQGWSSSTQPYGSLC